jgi:3-deoxy-manno-octulosonate cytidylyltransferase (CMP-KDO synthetase)
VSFKVYIPARYASSRLPGKVLEPIGDRTMLELVHARARASGAEEVVIATDDGRVADVARGFGATVCMTDPGLESGSDRIAAAAAQRGEVDAQVIVNLQGDEPFMPPAVIAQVAALAAAGAADVATVCEPLATRAEYQDPNIVKVVRGAADVALYFSRAPLPWRRDGGPEAWTPGPEYRRHVGLYAYTVGFLRRFVAWPPGALESIERLEQLRALAQGARIVVPDAVAACGLGVDTPADLARARVLAAAPA